MAQHANVQDAINQGNYKAAIKELERLSAIKATPELLLQLAVCQLEDQQEEAAFKTYLQCLEIVPVAEPVVMSAREKTAYNELLELYFANSQELPAKVEATLQKHPDFLHCQFLMASMSANARKYEPFFYIFFQSYVAYPNCHMSHKTKGMISTLILQRAKSIEEKEVWRTKAIHSFGLAITLCPEDLNLHKMILHTATEKERATSLQLIMTQVFANNVKIPRSEIPFYIRHALDLNQIDLAQQLLDKAQTWYEYSRILQEMQDLISQHKAEH
ncbi:MAG: hypothetical protein LLF94_00795 [Chlamydiales bacterium]|nr:hypothetical protein [Chlamydiales bacterium]